MVKISIDLPTDMYWRGKLLVFTYHFAKELQELDAHVELITDILTYGNHTLISKRKNKYNVTYPYRKKYIYLSYAIYDNIILIHIKPTRKK
ncbi:MAG: hypothetical protein OXR66_03235 [Candidatus Woesearchaeota archaeon]|nr:hypothetical protein [Candidatus Woesearchaeota archaeon]